VGCPPHQETRIPGDRRAEVHADDRRPAERTCFASGSLGEPAAKALKAGARRRAELGEFFGHIAYASMIAQGLDRQGRRATPPGYAGRSPRRTGRPASGICVQIPPPLLGKPPLMRGLSIARAGRGGIRCPNFVPCSRRVWADRGRLAR
jgi:hypothetical protein